MSQCDPKCLFCKDEGIDRPARYRVRGGPIYRDDTEKSFPLHCWLCEWCYRDLGSGFKLLEERG